MSENDLYNSFQIRIPEHRSITIDTVQSVIDSVEDARVILHVSLHRMPELKFCIVGEHLSRLCGVIAPNELLTFGTRDNVAVDLTELRDKIIGILQ